MSQARRRAGQPSSPMFVNPPVHPSEALREHDRIERELIHHAPRLSEAAWKAWEAEGRQLRVALSDEARASGRGGPASWISHNVRIGPALAVLTDPLVPTLSGDALDERLQLLISAHSTGRLQRAGAAGVVITGAITTAGLYLTETASGMVGLTPLALWALAPLVNAYRPPVGGRGRRLEWSAVGFRPIDLDVAREFAAARQQQGTAEARGRAVPAAPTQHHAAADPDEASDTHEAIAAALTVLDDLDRAWLEFITDTSPDGLRAFYFDMPALWAKPPAEPVLHYQAALYELREFLEGVPSAPSADEGWRAGVVAERAVTAWGAARSYAVQVGVGDGRSPKELSAARQLPKLIAQFVDAGTTAAQAGRLKVLIEEQMAQLTTRPATEHVAAINVLGGELHRVPLQPALEAPPAAR